MTAEQCFVNRNRLGQIIFGAFCGNNLDVRVFGKCGFDAVNTFVEVGRAKLSGDNGNFALAI